MKTDLRQRFENNLRELDELVSELEELPFGYRGTSGVYGIRLSMLAVRIRIAGLKDGDELRVKSVCTMRGADSTLITLHDSEYIIPGSIDDAP